MGVKLIEPSDAAWDVYVSRLRHDIYHTSGYAAVCQTEDGDTVRLAISERDGETLVAPILMRPIDSSRGRCDFASPYGYPAPVCTSDEARVQEALLGDMLDAFRNLGGVSAFFRSHPFVGLRQHAWESVGEVVRHGCVVWIDVDAAAEDPASTFRGGHRREIAKLERLGYTAESGRWDLYDQFPGVYRENMARVGAPTFYLFSDEYFAALRERLAGHVRFLTATAPNGDLAAAAILMTCDGIAQYHLSATVDTYRAHAPSKCFFPLMVRESHEAGAHRLNLGGGRGGTSDGLYEFKRGFSEHEAEFFTYRVVLDPGEYSRLATEPAPAGYFPAYRYEPSPAPSR